MKKIATLFDQAAESYDATRRKYVSCIDDFYGALIEQIPYPRESSFSVLDLGAGTGLLSAMVMNAFPNADLSLADISGEMLNKAKLRFKGKEGICYKLIDAEKDEFGGPYNIVISALALHHIPGPSLKKVVRKIFAALRPKGMFINADQILGNTPSIEKKYEEIWQYHVRKAGGTDEELAIAIERMKADRTSTLNDQLHFLKDAGFQDVNCWYQFYRYATYSGTKPLISK